MGLRMIVWFFHSPICAPAAAAAAPFGGRRQRPISFFNIYSRQISGGVLHESLEFGNVGFIG